MLEDNKGRPFDMKQGFGVSASRVSWAAFAFLCLSSFVAHAEDDTTLTLVDDDVKVDVAFDEGEWVSECTDYQNAQSCNSLSYKATYRMPTTGDKDIPFQLKLMLDDEDEKSYKVVLENGFLAEGLDGDLPEGIEARGLIDKGRYVFWRGASECSLMKSSMALPDGGVYCDFSKPLVGLAEDVFEGVRAGEGGLDFDGKKLLRVELIDPSGRKTEIDFLVPLSGLRSLFGGSGPKE